VSPSTLTEGQHLTVADGHSATIGGVIYSPGQYTVVNGVLTPYEPPANPTP